MNWNERTNPLWGNCLNGNHTTIFYFYNWQIKIINSHWHQFNYICYFQSIPYAYYVCLLMLHYRNGQDIDGNHIRVDISNNSKRVRDRILSIFRYNATRSIKIFNKFVKKVPNHVYLSVIICFDVKTFRSNLKKKQQHINCLSCVPLFIILFTLSWFCGLR